MCSQVSSAPAGSFDLIWDHFLISRLKFKLYKFLKDKFIHITVFSTLLSIIRPPVINNLILMLCSFFIISENVNCSGASVEGTSLEREQLAGPALS